MHHPDICIAGAGIIGLSLALELHNRGHRVTVLERGDALGEASTAAAGMLAAADPDNLPQLHPLASLSLSLYPNYLEGLRALSGIPVPFQTHQTLQALPHHVPSPASELTATQLAHLLPALRPAGHRFQLLEEHSLDPRQLAAALLAAIRTTTIDLRLHTAALSIHPSIGSVDVHTTSGSLAAAKFIDCTGAWSGKTSLLSGLRVTPKKGQMLSVALPPVFPLRSVVRTHAIYIVPRTTGPDAGRAIIGATVEDAGFNKDIHPSDIAHLRTLAEALLPPLAHAPQLETWSGLRPATPDSLPLMGTLPSRPNQLIATGHYRNGILLAPATALVMAQLISGEAPSIDLAPFSPDRAITQPA